jgi:glycosyltransferase involved in cell wall biosynthesis
MGGAEKIMIGIAAFLAEAGHEVDFVLAERRGELVERVPPAVRIVELEPASGAATVAVLSRFPPASLLDLARLAIRQRITRSLLPLAAYLRQESPRALLASIAKNSLVALFARHLADPNLRLVVREANMFSLQNAEYHGRDNPIVTRLAGQWYARADAIVAISQGVADDLTHSLGVPSECITTIYNPVDADFIARRAMRSADHPWLRSDVPLLLAVGRLAKQKDFATLVRAFALVRRERAARLLILGEGPTRRELEDLARELGVEQEVSLPGICPDPYPFMARAACFVLSSAWEGFGNVLVEALACGCPIVSTDCPSGPSEILAGGHFGRLAKTGDPADLARAITITLDEPRHCERQRSRSRDFSPAATYERYHDVILGTRSRVR